MWKELNGDDNFGVLPDDLQVFCEAILGLSELSTKQSTIPIMKT